MGIEFAIHTYGYHDAMFYVINGIKMIMDSEFNQAIINLMALVATSYYSLLGMMSANEGRVGHYFVKTGSMLIVVVALLQPKADILVVDRISGKKEVVSGLPYAFVLPVGVLEAFGAGITSIFEQAFSPVNSLPFKDYGMVFGHRLVEESRNWKIANPEFNRNMDQFIARCIVLESMIGTRFTPEDVYASGDIFKLVTEKAGTFRKIAMRIGGKEQRLTCKEAGTEFQKYLKEEYSFLGRKYAKEDFAIAGVSLLKSEGNQKDISFNKALKKNIELGYSSSLGIEGSAEEIIRQNMMINSIKDFNNKSDLYGYTKAKADQNSNWLLSSELAKEYLPLLLNIMKALVYASFVFMVPLMIISGGMGKYLKYAVLIFSLQIWPALNSVLNLFIELYGSLKANHYGGAITLSNFNQAHQSVDTIILVAGMLQASIPFLSFAIVQGGVGGFVHLAGQISGASASAASGAAHQVVSGSREMDNVSMGNQSLQNNNGFKTDWNQSYMEGAKQIQGAGGSMMRSFQDGSSAITSGAGINLSSGSRSLSLEDSQQSSLSESLTNSLSDMRAAEQNYSDAKTATITNARDLVMDVAKRESAGETFNYEQMGEQGKALQQAVNHTRDLVEHQGYSWDQLASGSVKGSTESSIGIPGFLPIKGSVTVGSEASVTASNKSDQGLSDDQRISRVNDINESFNNLTKAAQNQQWMQDHNIDTKYAENTRASLDKMKTYHEAATQKREEADVYSQALQASKASGATDRRDMYHELEGNIMRQYGVDQESAHQMIENYDTRANRVWDGMVAAQNDKLIAGVKNGREKIENSSAENAGNFKNEYASKVDDSGLQEIKEKANSKGVSYEQVKNQIDNTGNKVKDKQENMTKDNSDQYNSVKHHNTKFEEELANKAKKYEEDRIGQGKLGSKLGIGGPNALERAQQNLNDAKKK